MVPLGPGRGLRPGLRRADDQRDQVVVPGCETGLHVVESGEPAIAPVHIDNLDDGQYEWFHVRGGTIVDGLGDAEGNSPEIRTIDGVDLLGDHYAGWVVLSTDGSRLAYTEHRDPAAFSHFLQSRGRVALH